LTLREGFKDAKPYVFHTFSTMLLWHPSTIQSSHVCFSFIDDFWKSSQHFS